MAKARTARNTHQNHDYQYLPDINIPNARIFWTNFAGVERTAPSTGRIVNAAGKRNFAVEIPAEGVLLDDGSVLSPEEMLEMGYPLQIRVPEDEDAIPSYFLRKVQVGYKNASRRPVVWVVSGNKRTAIGEDAIDTLDGRTFSNVDLKIHPSPYTDSFSGERKWTVYLMEGFFYVNVSMFEKRWQNEHPDNEV